MRSSRTLFQRAVPSWKQQFILPPPTFVGSASAALQGVWSHLTDASARERYEQLVDTGVIQDRVLAKAENGSVLTMALFHQLQNPRLEKHKLDPKEFLDAIPRAIEVYTDTLGCLVRELNEEAEKEKSAKEKEDEVVSIAALKDQTVLQVSPNNDNPWHKQANEHPTSLAGRLSRMATSHLLDEHWFGANLFRVMAWTTATAHQYVPGSSHVKSVALLTARVEEAEHRSDDNKEEAFVDPDVPDIDRPIAAQWSVLYEMEQQFQQPPTTSKGPILSAADQYREILKEDSVSNGDPKKEENSSSVADAKVDASADDSAKKDATSDTTAATTENDEDAKIPTKENKSTTEETTTHSVTETSLVVAVLEAWVQTGGDGGAKEPFRWRVAHIREAHEFR